MRRGCDVRLLMSLPPVTRGPREAWRRDLGPVGVDLGLPSGARPGPPGPRCGGVVVWLHLAVWCSRGGSADSHTSRRARGAGLCAAGWCIGRSFSPRSAVRVQIGAPPAPGRGARSRLAVPPVRSSRAASAWARGPT